MVRWEPGTPERLQQAALELFATRGYEQTTAAEIAQAVNLTERTFFRHFSDKREVLFHNQHLLVEAFLAGVADAPARATPLQIVGTALHRANSLFSEEHRARSRERHAVIAKNPALQERERNKLADVGTALAGALRARGVAEPSATLAAKSGVTVFETSFDHWSRDGETRSLDRITTDLLDALLALR